MRTVLFASATMFALILAHPGIAQTTATDTQPRAVGQQSPAPADVSAPTDPTVPAELQPSRHDQRLDPQGRPLPRQHGADESQLPIQEAQNQVPPNQVQSLPGQQAAPHGQAGNQQGQAQPTDPGTPDNPAAPPAMLAPEPPDQVQSLPGQPAAPRGQGGGQQGQATPDQRGEAEPAPGLAPVQIADLI
jgi:hypothetical protein